MYDSTKLLRRLLKYQKSLESHLDNLRSEYNQLQKIWETFNRASEGDYAEQFRSGWAKTSDNFQVYINQSEKIKYLLEERIHFLDDFNLADIFNNIRTSKPFENTSSLPIANQQGIEQEELSLDDDIHKWDVDEQTIEDLKYNYFDRDDKEDKKDLSQYLGEEYGHKMATEILGYETILEPIQKYDSFPQGFDAVYFDPLTGETVITEFKGQGSPLSNAQEMTSYVDRVCQEIIVGKNPPYTNAPQLERDIAHKIKEELDNSNVRYEVYRTKFDKTAETLSTILEKNVFPDLSNIIIPKPSPKRNMTSGILDGLESYKDFLEDIAILQGVSSDSELSNYERIEAQKNLSEKLITFAEELYSSGNLSRSQKNRLTRALNKYKP